jgi:hypothetical protein
MEKQAEEYRQVESLVSPVLGYGIFASLCSEERIIGALINISRCIIWYILLSGVLSKRFLQQHNVVTVSLV